MTPYYKSYLNLIGKLLPTFQKISIKNLSYNWNNIHRMSSLTFNQWTKYYNKKNLLYIFTDRKRTTIQIFKYGRVEIYHNSEFSKILLKPTKKELEKCIYDSILQTHFK